MPRLHMFFRFVYFTAEGYESRSVNEEFVAIGPFRISRRFGEAARAGMELNTNERLCVNKVNNVLCCIDR